MKPKWLTILMILCWVGVAGAYEWEEEASPVAFDLSDVWAFNDDVAYAVGAGGVVLRCYHGTWSTMSHSVSVGSLQAVWGTDPNDVWAVGTGGGDDAL